MAKVLILLVLTTATLAATIFPKEYSNVKAHKTPKLIFVATVEGKSFFAENTPKRTWEAAAAFCTASNMKLASITSPSQLLALETAYGTAPGFTSNYWTSGRDANSWSQFRWNTTGNSLDSFIRYDNHAKNSTYRTCVTYESYGIGSSHIHAEDCSFETGTLCEI